MTISYYVVDFLRDGDGDVCLKFFDFGMVVLGAPASSPAKMGMGESRKNHWESVYQC